MKILSNLIGSIFGKIDKVRSQAKSQNNLDKMTAKGYELIGSMNQLLKEANTSKNIQLREGNLLKVNTQLKVLKDICSKYPAIYITQLEAFEASIDGVEAETLELKAAITPHSYNRSRQKFSDNDNEIILESINSHFRVINESIDIARKSKNLDTTESRLEVARNTLNRAREIANQFSLNIDGFDEAESEIDRITKAIKTGAPKVIDGMREIEPDPYFSNPSRNLLKEATALKKEKLYIEACDKLSEAYLADGAETLMIEDRLRLAMYLQLAGKSDEGWTELNRLLKIYNDQFSNQTILNQMKVFLKKENNQDATNPVRVIERVDVPKTSTIDSNLLETWRNNQDMISGLEFSATMQLRNPLRILERHGEFHSNINTEPPMIATEMWQGIWIPSFETDPQFKELPDCLPFLKSVREIVELDESIDSSINKLRENLKNSKWQDFLMRYGDAESIISVFFPRFVDTIPSLNAASIEELLNLGLVTANGIANATDETLLNINGIGKAKLKLIRDYCASVTKNRDDTRLENVIR